MLDNFCKRKTSVIHKAKNILAKIRLFKAKSITDVTAQNNKNLNKGRAQ